MNEETILRMEDIWKRFGATHALRGADLSVWPGEVHAIVGSNGAGKSTLMKVLAGIYRPDGGHIWFEGVDIAGREPLQMQRLGIHVVHQVLGIVGSMSVLENILLANPPLKGGLLNWREGAVAVRETLSRIGFSLDLTLPAGKLSASEQQFVILARALIHQPKLLVLDEPTARLGMRETQKLFGLIRTLKEQGTTVLYISHRIEEIYAISDRISVFRDGVHVRTDATGRFPEGELVQAMLGKRLDVFFPKADAPVGGEVLRIRGLRFGDRLNGVDLEICKGEIVSLIGAVGSGKTEVLHCLFGMEKPDGGTIEFKGRRINRRRPDAAMSDGMALIPEDRAAQGMIGDFGVGENLTSINMRLLQAGGLLSKRRERDLAARLIRRLDVRPPDASQVMTNLSGGNQQKVVVGKWLIEVSYHLYLMDEVTAGVDIEAKAEIYRIMGEIVQNGGAVLLATGDIEEAMGVSDRVMVLYKGKVVKQARPDETTKDELLSSIMGGGALV